MAEHEDDSEELRRQIDSLRRAFEKSEVERKADKRIQEAEMSAMQSSLDKGFAENREAIADNREAIADNRAAFERLRTDMERNSKHLMAFMAVLFGVATAVLGVLFAFLQQG